MKTLGKFKHISTVSALFACMPLSVPYCASNERRGVRSHFARVSIYGESEVDNGLVEFDWPKEVNMERWGRKEGRSMEMVWKDEHDSSGRGREICAGVSIHLDIGETIQQCSNGGIGS